jgi:hypothetical protein
MFALYVAVDVILALAGFLYIVYMVWSVAMHNCIG